MTNFLREKDVFSRGTTLKCRWYDYAPQRQMVDTTRAKMFIAVSAVYPAWSNACQQKWWSDRNWLMYEYKVYAAGMQCLYYTQLCSVVKEWPKHHTKSQMNSDTVLNVMELEHETISDFREMTVISVFKHVYFPAVTLKCRSCAFKWIVSKKIATRQKVGL